MSTDDAFSAPSARTVRAVVEMEQLQSTRHVERISNRSFIVNRAQRGAEILLLLHCSRRRFNYEINKSALTRVHKKVGRFYTFSIELDALSSANDSTWQSNIKLIPDDLMVYSTLYKVYSINRSLMF